MKKSLLLFLFVAISLFVYQTTNAQSINIGIGVGPKADCKKDGGQCNDHVCFFEVH